jgi:hypothetical protein
MRIFITTGTTYEEATYYVGTADEVKALYKSITRACRAGNTELKRYHLDDAKFNPYKMYGLCIDSDNWVTIVAGDTILRMIVCGDIE